MTTVRSLYQEGQQGIITLTGGPSLSAAVVATMTSILA